MSWLAPLETLDEELRPLFDVTPVSGDQVGVRITEDGRGGRCVKAWILTNAEKERRLEPLEDARDGSDSAEIDAARSDSIIRGPAGSAASRTKDVDRLGIYDSASNWDLLPGRVFAMMVGTVRVGKERVIVGIDRLLYRPQCSSGPAKRQRM